MENNTKNKAIAAVLLLIVGFGAGYFAKPSKVETIVKTVEVNHTQIDTKTDIKEKKDKVVHVIYTKDKDGNVKTDTTIEDRGSVDTDSSKKEVVDTKKESESKQIVMNDLGLSVQGLAGVNISNLTDKSYGVMVKKRLVSNISGSISVITNLHNDNKVLIGLGVDF